MCYPLLSFAHIGQSDIGILVLAVSGRPLLTT